MASLFLAFVLSLPIALWFLIRYLLAPGSKRQKRKTLHVKDVHDVNEQSIIMPGPERIRRRKCPFLPHGELLEYYDESVTTLYENFLHGIRESENGPCLGYRPTPESPYVWINYQTVHDRAVAFGSGLIATGNPSGQNTFVGIYSANRPEYDIASLATAAYSMVLVPLYDTLGAEAVAHILNHAELRVVICDKGNKVEKVISNTPNIPQLREVIVMEEGDITPELRSTCMYKGINIFSFSDVEEMGQRAGYGLAKPKPDDLCLINYTSGTTGIPKGVMLTHRNIICHPQSLALISKNTLDDVDTDPKFFGAIYSYLPLAHNFGQCVHAQCLYFGYRLGYWSGDVKKISDDLKALKPSVVPTVPRVLNKVFNAIQGQLGKKGPVANFIFKLAYNAKLKEIQNRVYSTDTIWDKLVFGKIQDEFGGMTRMMFCGAAPLSEEVLMMCRVAFGCVITEGYGQTESCSGGTLTMGEDLQCGHVGAPVPFAEIKVCDVPEMGYSATDDEGEICIRGPSVMLGYYKDPVKTAETIDKDGWLHTGDIGKWLPNGTLKIIDRKKHIFKLAQGEYIAPEKIEGIYQTNPIVEQVFVDGRSLERSTVAIVVPVSSELTKIAKSLDLDHLPDEELCKSPEIMQNVLASLQATGKKHGLAGFEQVQAVYLTTELFSTENDCMTATMKLKRPQCREYYTHAIDKMYNELRNKE